MLRGPLPHTLLTVLLALLFLAPPTLGWRGVLDCAKRCHLAYTTGAHCPLTYTTQSSHSHHHCHHHSSTQQHDELRCGCPGSSSPTSANLEGSHFLLPLSLNQEVLALVSLQTFEQFDSVATIGFSPPDPPPRLFVALSA